MDNKTIRLILPQWQGGNRYVYAFGAKLLEWLAPAANCETLEIPLIPKTPEVIKDGIAFKEELLRHSGEIYQVRGGGGSGAGPGAEHHLVTIQQSRHSWQQGCFCHCGRNRRR